MPWPSSQTRPSRSASRSSAPALRPSPPVLAQPVTRARAKRRLNSLTTAVLIVIGLPELGSILWVISGSSTRARAALAGCNTARRRPGSPKIKQTRARQQAWSAPRQWRPGGIPHISTAGGKEVFDAAIHGHGGQHFPTAVEGAIHDHGVVGRHAGRFVHAGLRQHLHRASLEVLQGNVELAPGPIDHDHAAAVRQRSRPGVVVPHVGQPAHFPRGQTGPVDLRRATAVRGEQQGPTIGQPGRLGVDGKVAGHPLELPRDRKSTRLNSSHVAKSYAVFCWKKKKTKHPYNRDTLK